MVKRHENENHTATSARFKRPPEVLQNDDRRRGGRHLGDRHLGGRRLGGRRHGHVNATEIDDPDGAWISEYPNHTIGCR